MKRKPLIVGAVLVAVGVAYLLAARTPEPAAVDATAGPPVVYRVSWTFDAPHPAAATAELTPLNLRVVLNLHPPDGPERPTVFELDKRTGRPRWAFDAAGTLRRPLAPPSMGGPFVGDAAGRLFALDSDTAAVRWERTLGGPLGRPMSGASNDLFVAAGDAGLVKLDTRTGKPVWQADIRAAAHGPLQHDNERVYVLGRGPQPALTAVRMDTGRLEWAAPLPLPAIDSDFWAGSGLLIVPLADPDAPAGGLIAFDPETGRQRWHRTLPAPTVIDPHLHRMTHPLTGERMLLLAAAGDTVRAVEATTGRVYWAARVGSPVVGPPAFVWMFVFAATADGRLVMLDYKSGSPVGVCDLAPLVGDRPTVLAAAVGPHTTLVVEVGGRVKVVQLEYVSGLNP